MDKELIKSKGYKTEEDLLKEILQEEPNFSEVKIVPINQSKEEQIIDYSDKIKVLNFSDLKECELKLIEYLVYPILPTQGLGFIYAATGVGKTLFALNMAYAIASGGNFIKYKCPIPKKVLYIDGEMAFNQIHSRIIQIANREGNLIFPENLNLITPDKVMPFKLPKIDDINGQEIYNKIIDKYNIEVIFIDNLSVLSSFEENKGNEWNIIQDWLLKLRAKGKSCWCIHHAGKDKTSYRGTSKMLDSIDVAISLQPVNEDITEESKIDIKKFKVVYQKNRIFGGKDSESFEIQLQNNIWSYQSNEQTTIEKIVECNKAGMSQREIAKELILSQTTVNRLIKKARYQGLIQYN